jgi:hypothetical protein
MGAFFLALTIWFVLDRSARTWASAARALAKTLERAPASWIGVQNCELS